MKSLFLISSLAIAGSALAASGTETVTGFIPSGLVFGATTAATSFAPSYADLLVGVSASLPKFDALGMVGVPDDATLVSVSYSFNGKLWIDWTLTTGSDPQVSYLGGLTATGPDGGSSVGAFGGVSPVLTGSSGTFVFSPIPGGLFNVLDTDEDLFDVAQSAGSTVSFTLTSNPSSFFSVGGGAGAAGSALPFAGVEVAVNYNWQTTEVPEASTYTAAFGLVGLVGFRWLRSRR